jgi:L-asparaginase
MESKNGTNGHRLRIKFLTTGGSIDKTYSPSSSTFEIENSAVKEFLGDGMVKFDFSFLPICKKDSLDMTDEDRSKIRAAVEKCTERNIIITHGTDTIVETGKYLGEQVDKVVVLTGAFKPIRLRRTDAVLNLGMAIAAVQILQPGVYIAINGMVSPVAGARKDKARQVFSFAAIGNSTKSGKRAGAVTF